MDNLFEQMANISKAHAYDILAAHVGELKEIIRSLIEVGELEDLTFTNDEDSERFKKLVNKAKILSLK